MSRQNPLEQVIAVLHEAAELKRRIAQELVPHIIDASRLLVECLANGRKLLFFGNGGSAADAQHLAAEFVGRFVKERRALPAIALTTDSSILTAIGNDYTYERVFARQIEALGRRGDVAIGISTSGNSPNVIEAFRVAASQGLKTIGLAGKNGGRLAAVSDIAIVVPSASTARIQECHITVGHLLCELVETELFGDAPPDGGKFVTTGIS